MKFLNITFFLLISVIGFAQTNEEIIEGIKQYQAEENEKFRNKETTILDSLDLLTFTSLEFYEIDLQYRVEAKLTRTPNAKPFLMKTSTDRLPEYVQYAIAEFKIDGKDLKLNIYKSTRPVEEPEDDYVFLPFTDLTSGDGSYGGGRYLELDVPEGETMIIDFNMAYNPYCSYSHRYSCPVPPKENDLLVRVEAGVKDYGKH
jgi:uncharacterized protein (DUF1684 family)